MSPWVALPQAALGLLCRRSLLWAMVLSRLAPLDLREDVLKDDPRLSSKPAPAQGPTSAMS